MKLSSTSVLTVLLSLSVVTAQAGHHDLSIDSEEQPSGPALGKHKARMTERMKRIDSNGDGKIERAEFLAHAEQRFEKMDANRDGFITPEEGKAAHKKMREAHRKHFKKRHHIDQ